MRDRGAFFLDSESQLHPSLQTYEASPGVVAAPTTASQLDIGVRAECPSASGREPIRSRGERRERQAGGRRRRRPCSSSCPRCRR